MVTPTDLPSAVAPAAAALVVAVDDYSADDVADILKGLDRQHLTALAVVLAANVSLDAPLRLVASQPKAPQSVLDQAAWWAATRFDTSYDDIFSKSRVRNASEARAVVMAVARLAGMSSPYIGARFKCDHTTVLYATGRCGNNRSLRLAVRELAEYLELPRADETVMSA